MNTALAFDPVVPASPYELQPSFPQTQHAAGPAQRIGRAIELLRRVSPAITSRLLWRLWFTPPSVLPNRRAHELLATVEHCFEVYSGDEGVLVYQWGEGPAVLLAHGWGTYGAHLGSFVAPLVKAGYSVLLFDAPGHGGKPRREYRLDQYAQLLQDIILHVGDLHAVIAHSLGASAAAIALHQLEMPARLVSIAPSANLKTAMQTFQHKLALSEASIELLRQRCSEYFGADVWSRYSLDHHFPELSGPALLVHDEDDSEASAENSRYLQRLRPDAGVLLTQGKGHNRILHDEEVVEAVTRFVSAYPDSRRNH